MLEAMARIAPSQPNDAMARIASRRNKASQVNALPKAKSQAKDKRAKDSSLLHVLGRSAKTDESGRSFAVLSTQVSAVGLRLRLVVPRPMPAAVASRCCGRRFQQLECA